jgi:signal peptidase I
MIDNNGNIFLTPILEDLLQQNKLIQISLTGFSMFPFLMHGDIVQTTSVETEQLKCGDIVVFKMNDRWIAHRLIKKNIDKNLFFTRGDSRAIKDFPVNQNQIKGIVVKIVKSRWKLAHFSIGKYGKYIVFFSPITALFFNLIIRLFGVFSKLMKNRKKN